MKKDFLNKGTKEFTLNLIRSYKHWTKESLIPQNESTDEMLTNLFNANFICASHNNTKDPIFQYGNKKTLELWEVSWEELLGMHSKETAETMHRDERKNLLDSVSKNGFIDNYSGVRISSTGRRFKIENAMVWNVMDLKGNNIGQAVKFSKWSYV